MFHLARTSKFHVPYRHHDPEKERKEEREARIKSELGMDIEENRKEHYSPSIRGRFRDARDNQGAGRFGLKERKKSNLRVLTIFLVFAFTAYIYLWWIDVA